MRATVFYSVSILKAVLAYSALGRLSQPFLIRPCGLPSRMFQPDRDRAYRTPRQLLPAWLYLLHPCSRVLGALDFLPENRPGLKNSLGG